jgi:hypothetical protein
MHEKKEHFGLMLFNLLVHGNCVKHTFLHAGEVCVCEDFSLLHCYAASSGKWLQMF